MEVHEQDFYLWTKQTAELLEAGLWQEVDLTNLIAEIRNMGSNDKHALKSNLRILLIHLLKWQFQPAYRTNSWMSSIVEHRQRIEELLEKSPSLQPYLEEVFKEVYPKAAKGAEKQTGLSLNIFPVDCPYTLQQILDIDLLPN